MDLDFKHNLTRLHPIMSPFESSVDPDLHVSHCKYMLLRVNLDETMEECISVIDKIIQHGYVKSSNS